MAGMDAAAFARMLGAMMPEGFVVVEGCVLWPHYDPPSEAHVQEQLVERRRHHAGTSPPAAAQARARAAYEHDYNRRFIFAELGHIGMDGESWTTAAIVACA